ncbi:MAG: hypothetical protein AAF742_05570 [Pseudomonadota bacterium]
MRLSGNQSTAGVIALFIAAFAIFASSLFPMVARPSDGHEHHLDPSHVLCQPIAGGLADGHAQFVHELTQNEGGPGHHHDMGGHAHCSACLVGYAVQSETPEISLNRIVSYVYGGGPSLTSKPVFVTDGPPLGGRAPPQGSSTHHYS